MNMDKPYPKSLTAKRMKLAIQVDDSIPELLNKLSIDPDTVRHWPQKAKGVPASKLIAVAQCLKVKPSIFTDEELSDEDVIAAISDARLKRETQAVPVTVPSPIVSSPFVPNFTGDGQATLPLQIYALTADRIFLAANIKHLQVRRIASKLNTSLKAILDWERTGFPKEFILALGRYFNVDERVFIDIDITRQEFIKIISKSDYVKPKVMLDVLEEYPNIK